MVLLADCPSEPWSDPLSPKHNRASVNWLLLISILARKRKLILGLRYPFSTKRALFPMVSLQLMVRLC